ncbi:MAG: hypothetical protein EOP32_22365 [Rhodococcus sp. (in: high G+C Gram-positive bacteria)]|nr:MAG: hypothetical protein EOP32_22365 [Rhodococcus sp. (in: high G+C Gram-positive bacteria)]
MERTFTKPYIAPLATANAEYRAAWLPVQVSGEQGSGPISCDVGQCRANRAALPPPELDLEELPNVLFIKLRKRLHGDTCSGSNKMVKLSYSAESRSAR